MIPVAEALQPPFNQAFSYVGTLNRTSLLLLSVCLVVNGIVLTNAVLNDPYSGPDHPVHLNYISTLAELNVPVSRSPPLPYLIPAILMRVFSLDVWWAAKWAQLFNVILSIGLIVYLTKTCEIIKPNDASLKLGTICFLGLLTVYYKTLAWVRAEPYVTFWAVAVVYYMLVVFLRRDFRRRQTIKLAVSIALLLLSRQWGLLVVPALVFFIGGVFLKDRRDALENARVLSTILIICLAVAGWFFLAVHKHTGSFLGLSTEGPGHFKFSNQPSSFYFGLSVDRLFSEPVRPGFGNQFMPVFYSDIWGDYRAHFIVYGVDTRTGLRLTGRPLEQALRHNPRPAWLVTNREAVAPYLARVNIVSLLPFAIALAGLISGVFYLCRFVAHRLPNSQTKALALCMMVTGCSLAGYMWFLIRYPNFEYGDTIKATYMLHMFPFVAILVGNLLSLVHQKSPSAYTAVLALLGAVFLHNLPAMLTRYVP